MGSPPAYENTPLDRDEAVDFIISAAKRMGFGKARIEGPIPAGAGYDVRMPVECLAGYYSKAWDNGVHAAIGALAEMDDATFLSGRDAVICAMYERFEHLDPAA